MQYSMHKCIFLFFVFQSPIHTCIEAHLTAETKYFFGRTEGGKRCITKVTKKNVYFTYLFSIFLSKLIVSVYKVCSGLGLTYNFDHSVMSFSLFWNRTVILSVILYLNTILKFIWSEILGKDEQQFSFDKFLNKRFYQPFFDWYNL